MKIWFEYLFLKCDFSHFIVLLKFFLDVKISKKSFNLKLFQIDFHKNHFWNTTFSKNCDFDYVLFFNNVCLCYMMSKLVFQFRKNEYKKTCNILKNDFIKSIFKNTKKKSIFLKLEQTHPLSHDTIHKNM